MCGCKCMRIKSQIKLPHLRENSHFILANISGHAIFSIMDNGVYMYMYLQVGLTVPWHMCPPLPQDP